MWKKWYIILICVLLVVYITGCSKSNQIINMNNDIENSTEDTTTNIVETYQNYTKANDSTTEITMEQNNEKINLPDKNNLTDLQQSLLPYYNNGFSLTPGDRVLYYLGERVADEISVYADQSYFWTTTDDFVVYYRGEAGNGEGKLLKKYDLKSGTDTELREWQDLQKYGNATQLISDGKHLFALFEGADRYNIVEIEANGQDTLLSQFYFNYDEFEEGNTHIEFKKPIASGEEYKFYLYGTSSRYSSETHNHNIFNRKYVIDYRTAEYKCVDEFLCEGELLSSGFTPTNKYYYGEETEMEDDLTGYSYPAHNIYEYDRNTESSRLLATIPNAKSTIYDAENGFATDKYLYCYGYAIDLSDGKVCERNTVTDMLKSVVDYGIGSWKETAIIHRINNK